MRLRINAGDKNSTIGQGYAIAKAYGDKFIFSLEFEMLDSAMPYYQAGLGNRLCYKITFNKYGKFINASLEQTPSSDATCKITDITLEYEVVTQPDLTSRIATKHQNMALQFDRNLRHRQIIVNKSDTMWNWTFKGGGGGGFAQIWGVATHF